LRFMLRTAGLHLPCWKARPRASTPRSPQTPAGYYKGDLVPPLTGLAPASHRELSVHTERCAPPWGQSLLRSFLATRSFPPPPPPYVLSRRFKVVGSFTTGPFNLDREDVSSSSRGMPWAKPPLCRGVAPGRSA